MDPQFVHPNNLPEHISTSTPIMPIPVVNSYRRNSVTPSPNQLPPQQQNFILNHNYAYSQFSTSFQNVNHQNFNSLGQRNDQLERENVRLWGILSNPNTVPKEQYDEVLKEKETFAANNEQLIKNNRHHVNQSEIFKQEREDLNKRLDSEKTTCVNVQKQCEELTLNNNKLAKKVQELEQSLKASEKNVESQQHKISSLQKSHATTLKELEESVGRGKSEVTKLKKEFNDEMNDLESNKATLQAEYEQFKSQNEEDVGKLKLQLESSGEKVSLLATENENLKEKIKASECEMTTLQTEYEQKNSKNEEKVSKLQLELKTVKTKLADKEQELLIVAGKRYTMRIDENRAIAKNKVETDKLKKSLEGARKNVCSLAGDKANLLEQVKTLKHEVLTLKTEKLAVAKNNQNVIQLNQHLKEAKAEIEIAKERIRKLEQDKANAKLEFDAEKKRLQEKNHGDNSAYDQLIGEILTLEENVVELTKKLKLEKEKCKEVQSRCDEVTMCKEILQTQVETGKATVQNMEQKFIHLENCHQIAMKELKSSYEKVKLEFNSDIEQLKQKLESESELLRQANTAALDQNNKIETLKTELAENVKMQRKLNEITTQNKRLSKIEREKNETSASAKDLDNLKTQTKFLNEQLQNRLEEVQNLQSEIKLLKENPNENEIAELKSQVENKSKFIADLETTVRKSENKERHANAAVKVLKTQGGNLRSRNESLSSQLECSLKEVQNLQAENKSLRETSKTALSLEYTKAIDALELANKNLENQLQQKIISLEEELKQEKLAKTLRMQIIEESDKQINQFAKQVEENKNKIKAHESTISSKEGRVKLLLNQLKNRELDNVKLERRLKALEKKLNHSERENTKLNQLIHDLGRSLQESMKKIHKENEEIDSLKSQVASIEKSLEEKKDELENNEKYVTQLCMKLCKLQSDNEQLKPTNKTKKADPFREESPAKKARKEIYELTRHGQGADDDDDFLWKMIRKRLTDN